MFNFHQAGSEAHERKAGKGGKRREKAGVIAAAARALQTFMSWAAV